MGHFEKVYKKMEIFRKEEMIDKEKFFDIFCKATINSHSIHTNAGTEVGMALDLGNWVSIFYPRKINNFEKFFKMLLFTKTSASPNRMNFSETTKFRHFKIQPLLPSHLFNGVRRLPSLSSTPRAGYRRL